jgi:hypothetical protein
MRVRRALRARRFAAALSVLLAVTAAAGGCAQAATTPAPSDTAVPIGPTAWPVGTIGKTGLRIDPSLLGRLPRFVGSQPIVEDAQSELLNLDDAALAGTFDRYASASVAQIGAEDWLEIDMGHFKDPSQASDILPSWHEEYATGACAQADGVTSSRQETINDWNVDISVCGGGPVVYTLLLGDGVVLSMFGMGSKNFGLQLIRALY